MIIHGLHFSRICYRVGLICSFVCLAFSGTVHAQYNLYTANLHIHTQVSNQLRTYDGFDSLRGLVDGFDHVLTQTPSDTLSRAVNHLDVIGLSDHGGAITANEWQQLADATDGNTSIIALRGFEWTGASHLNVFGTSSYTDTGYFGDGAPPSITASIPTLYSWLKSAGMKAGYGSEPVVQFNHLNYGNQFNGYSNWDPQIDRIVCLAELGSAETPFYSQASDQEPQFRSALQAGWHVAPTIGEDNQFGFNYEPTLDEASTRHIGIWATSFDRSSVMDALRARRIFASEDKNVSLKFTVKTNSNGAVHWMGETVKADPNSVVYSVEVTDASGLAKDQYQSVDLMTSASSMPFHSWGGTSNTSAEFYKQMSIQDLFGAAKTSLDQTCFYLRLKQKGILGIEKDYIYSAPIWIKYWTPVTGAISEDTTWTPDDNPYLVKGPVTVATGKTLTIMPGTVVKFADSTCGLTVNGRIVAQGTPDSPICFTSIKDDSLGGDSNYDGSGSTPSRGEWGGIRVTGTGATGSFEHCVVRYGGGNGSGSLSCTDGATMNVANCTITDSSSYGIYASSSTTNIKNSIIGYCTGSGLSLSGVVSLTYSDTWQNGSADTLAGEVTSMGNIHTDPKFVSLQSGDLRLGDGSPCIDTGDPQLLDADGSRSDMGALAAAGVANYTSLAITVAPGEDYLGSLNKIRLNYNIAGPQTYTGSLNIDNAGKANIANIQPGKYGLSVFGSHWLRRVINDIDMSKDTSLSVSLANGDADGDNQINLFDFVVLDQHFDTSNAMADLDGSGQVNLFDYVIIDENFGAQGDWLARIFGQLPDKLGSCSPLTLTHCMPTVLYTPQPHFRCTQYPANPCFKLPACSDTISSDALHQAEDFAFHESHTTYRDRNCHDIP